MKKELNVWEQLLASATRGRVKFEDELMLSLLESKIDTMISELVSENIRLREALEFYAVDKLSEVCSGQAIDEVFVRRFYDAGHIAREALKEKK